jgi:uncharacterized membrane protein
MKDYIERHFGGILGGGIGLVLAALLLTIGFLRTLVILIFVVIGAFLGSNKALRTAIKNVIDKIFNRKEIK